MDAPIINDDITEEEEDKIVVDCQRRRSSFSLAKLGLNLPILNFIVIHSCAAPTPPDPVEGTWKLIQCENFEKYLENIGTGPLSMNMVMRANIVVTITQACWFISQWLIILLAMARAIVQSLKLQPGQ